MKHQESFAEIIESSLVSWRARSWQWDYAPAFGSLVSLHSGTRQLFGLVYHSEFGSSDQTRQPYTYQKTEDELKAEHPQIFEFLMTSFLMVPVGFCEEGSMYYQLPPVPPKIHTFVSYADPQEEILFFSNAAFLHTLFGLAEQISLLDELLLALLKNISQKNMPPALVHNFITTYSELACRDYARVRFFCQRAQYVLGNAYV